MTIMAKMGRPELPPEERREKMVGVPLNEAEHAELKKIAEREGVSMASWCRDRILRAIKSSRKTRRRG